MKSRLQEDFSAFTGNAGMRHRGTDTELGTQLRKLVPAGHVISDRVTVSGKRHPVYKFPSLVECRGHFETLINQKINWPTEGVALKDTDN